VPLRVCVVNVGQGDSILFQLPSDRWGLVDCNIASWRESVPVDALTSMYGVDALSVLALSHPDSDHYLGMPQWIDRFSDSITDFWDSGLSRRGELVLLKNRALRDSARSHHPRRMLSGLHLSRIYQWFDARHASLSYRRYCSGELMLREPGLAIECWSPCDEALASIDTALLRCAEGTRRSLPNLNRASGVLAVFYGGTCVFLGADATGGCWTTMLAALERRDFKDVNQSIVKVPHHGSRDSNPEKAWDFLKERLSATSAIVSAAKHNRYGHPHKETIERILDAGVDLVCTSGVEYKKRDGEVLQRDTWTAVYERSGRYDEHGQNVEVVVPEEGYPRITTRRFG
jgi:beta-lactamase superfamily II metal-dependent hydrolase